MPLTPLQCQGRKLLIEKERDSDLSDSPHTKPSASGRYGSLLSSFMYHSGHDSVHPEALTVVSIVCGIGICLEFNRCRRLGSATRRGS
jgi:hypothetical protein